ncbi:MAG: ribonuclease Z [archaeon]|nr:ribonuclease Z [archaeon]
MTTVTFLGTGCMQPTKQRNHAGILLSSGTENILFDCGEGIQRQMRVAGIKPAKVTRLCITHFHGDHVFGIAGLMSSMGADQFAKKLHVYGPKGTKKYLDHLWKSFAAKDIIEHEVHEVSSGVFFENESFSLEAQPLKHSTTCIGFKFKENDKRRIMVAKANKLGLEGPILGKLQQGNNVVVKGKTIRADEITTLVRGKIVSYVTDTALCNGVNKLAKEADLLIIEGTFLDDLEENASKSNHLTVKQAALVASENNVKKLVITHLSQRYKSSADATSEARDYFDESVIAEDFMKIEV